MQRCAAVACQWLKQRMKKVYNILLAGCITLALHACKKDKGKGNDTPNDLAGAWELAESSAAMLPGVKTYAPGNGNTISFEDGRYARYANGQLIKEGTYTIVEDDTVEESVCLVNLKDKYTQRLDLDANNGGTKTFIYINDGQLSMIAGCYALDGGHKEVYRRINNIDDDGTSKGN